MTMVDNMKNMKVYKTNHKLEEELRCCQTTFSDRQSLLFLVSSILNTFTDFVIAYLNTQTEV